MGTPVKQIVLSGYYGFNNSGDEAVLLSILLALKELGERQGVQFDPVVLSVNPEETRKTYGVKSVHRMKPSEVWGVIRGADGLISGGGSLLQDETGWKTIPYYLAIIRMASWLGKPVFVYSQGIGPVNRPFFYRWIRAAFKKCSFLSVRDEESKELLGRMGLPLETIQVVPDPVMGLPLRRQPSENKANLTNPMIGVSARFWNKDRSDLMALADTIRIVLSQTDANVRFLPFHLPSDEEASLYVIERIGENYKHRISIAQNAIHPQDMLEEVASCNLIIGMRLHSLIYSASQLVPLVGMSYDPKIDQFLNRLQMKAASSTKDPNASSMVQEIMSLLNNADQWKRDKQLIIERLKDEAHQPAEQIALFYAKGWGSQ